MLFMVWSDTGDCIKAYCIPDSYSGTPKLQIIANGAVQSLMEPNEINEGARSRHETCLVGFSIDEQLIPGLADVKDLELREAETGILVYRRPPAGPTISECVFRLETHLMPLWRLDAAFSEKFRFWYDRIEQHSAETAHQILVFHSFGSLYASGRILFKNYEMALHDHFKTVMMMHEPYEELAERMLIFSRLGKDATRLLGPRDSLHFAAVMEMCAGLQSLEEKELRRILAKAAPDVLSTLADPVLRQLTSATPGDPPDRGGFARALSGMSEFAAVGIRNRADIFLESLSALLHVPLNQNEIRPSARVKEVADHLRAIKWIEPLIEHDLALYAQLERAVQAAEG